MSRYLKQDGNLIPLERYNADNGLSTTSENAVQNKVITQEILDAKADIESGLSGKSGLFKRAQAVYRNASAVSVGAGKTSVITLTLQEGEVADMNMGILGWNSPSGIHIHTCWASTGCTVNVRNYTSATISIGANSIQVNVEGLKFL